MKHLLQTATAVLNRPGVNPGAKWASFPER